MWMIYAPIVERLFVHCFKYYYLVEARRKQWKCKQNKCFSALCQLWKKYFKTETAFLVFLLKSLLVNWASKNQDKWKPANSKYFIGFLREGVNCSKSIYSNLNCSTLFFKMSTARHFFSKCQLLDTTARHTKRLKNIT
jgi:hypothetical protein